MQGKISLLILLLFLNINGWAKPPQSDWKYYQKQGHRTEKWDALVEAGFDTFAGSNLETAQNFFQRAIALGCKDGLVLFKLAQIIEVKGNLKGALDLYTQIKPILEKQYAGHPDTKELPERIAGIYYQLGRYAQALPLYLETIQTQGENFIRVYLVGQIYRLTDKPKEAIGFFEKALILPVPAEAMKLKPLAQVELMRLYYAANDLAKAAQIIETILAEQPSHPDALTLRDQIRRAKFREEEHKTWEKMLNR